VPREVARLPTAPGVYRFRDARDRVLYIGRATNLRSRVRSYWGDLRGRPHLRRMLPRVRRVEALACASVHEAAWLERNLLERALPYWNRSRGGAEVPVYVVLDSAPATPALAVVHDPRERAGAECFGPYLGGARVRTAVGGLLRVLPLSYTGDRLDGAGRDLARLRGVGPADRVRIARTLTAVLRRDRAALEHVRAALADRREGAVAELAFERAGEIQAELAAVQWLVAEQRVTFAEPIDADVYGWADGHLLHCRIRTGRMDQWWQRACSAEEAAPRLATTDTRWRTFADRNAELAALLRRP
jgi:excinuclease ABC subunit C